MDREWEEWLSTRPQVIQDMADATPPWHEYLLKTTGQTVRLHSYSEDGTVTVDVISPPNLLGDLPTVFGIDPSDLEVISPVD